MTERDTIDPGLEDLLAKQWRAFYEAALPFAREHAHKEPAEWGAADIASARLGALGEDAARESVRAVHRAHPGLAR